MYTRSGVHETLAKVHHWRTYIIIINAKKGGRHAKRQRSEISSALLLEGNSLCLSAASYLQNAAAFLQQCRNTHTPAAVPQGPRHDMTWRPCIRALKRTLTHDDKQKESHHIIHAHTHIACPSLSEARNDQSALVARASSSQQQHVLFFRDISLIATLP